jgi:hypothetical protein
MSDFDTFSTYVEMCCWINTLFGIYSKVTQKVNRFLNLGIEASMRLGRWNLDESKVQNIYTYSVECQKTQHHVSLLFRLISSATALFCLYIIYLGSFPPWFSPNYRFALVLPLPVYVVIAFVMVMVQMVGGIRVLWQSRTPLPFKLPDNIGEQGE